jgi:protocatechuate 3,4-dioxygenase beta subunit
VATHGDHGSEPFDVGAGRVNRTEIERGPRPMVRGVVLAPDGTAVPGAYIFMDYASRYSSTAARGWHGTITNREGRFELGFHSPYSFEEVSREDWRLNVRAPDRPPEILHELRVPTLETPTEVKVRLTDGLVLEGRVLDPAGGSAAGAEVRIAQWGFLHVAATDGQGSFRVPGLEDGHLTLFAVHPTGRYPLDEHSPAEFDRLPADVIVRLQKVLAVAGRVVDDRGRPLGSVAVVLRKIAHRAHDADTEKTLSKIDPRIRARYRARLEDIWSDKVGDAATGDDGRFRIENVPEGEYEIILKPGQWAEAGLLWTVAGRVQSGQEDLVLTPDLGAILTGVVLGPDGEPVSGAHVIGAWQEPEGWGPGMAHTRFRPVARTDGAGRFRLTGLPHQPDVVAVARDLPPKLLERVPEDADLTIRLDRGLAISGTLLRPDGTPFAGLDLKLPALDEQVRKRMQRIEAIAGSGWFHAVGADRLARRTDAHGRFHFGGLLPGRYKLLQDRPMVGKEDPILPRTVVEAGAKPLGIRTRTPLTISGRVVDEQGEPVVRQGDNKTGVNAYQAEGHKTWTGATSWDFVDIDGRFELGGLLPGEVRITVEAGDEYEPFELKTSAGTKGLRLVLKRKR